MPMARWIAPTSISAISTARICARRLPMGGVISRRNAAISSSSVSPIRSSACCWRCWRWAIRSSPCCFPLRPAFRCSVRQDRKSSRLYSCPVSVGRGGSLMTPAQHAQGAVDRSHIHIREINSKDLRAALADGLGDFKEKRGDIIIIGFAYPVVGLLLAVLAMGYSLIPVLFPLAAGISLLGPAAAAGFYELARRRERGLDSRWRHFFDVRSEERPVGKACGTTCRSRWSGVQ